MVETLSTMLSLGVEAPDFSLPDVNGKRVSLDDFAGAPALLVIFMCNHCPYVKHVADVLSKLTKEYQRRGNCSGGNQFERCIGISRRLAGKNGRGSQTSRLQFSVSLR